MTVNGGTVLGDATWGYWHDQKPAANRRARNIWPDWPPGGWSWNATAPAASPAGTAATRPGPRTCGGSVERLCGVAEAAPLRPVTVDADELLHAVRGRAGTLRSPAQSAPDVDQLADGTMAADPHAPRHPGGAAARRRAGKCRRASCRRFNGGHRGHCRRAHLRRCVTSG